MKYIKLFEDFEESQINKLKEDFDGILVELVDKGFYIKYDFSKPYNRRDEVVISIYRLNGGDTSLLFKYEDVKEYIKTIKDYMDIYYKNECDIVFKIGNYPKWTNKSYDRFIFGEEESKRAKSFSINKDDNMFQFIKLNFKIKNNYEILKSI